MLRLLRFACSQYTIAGDDTNETPPNIKHSKLCLQLEGMLLIHKSKGAFSPGSKAPYRSNFSLISANSWK